MRGAHRTGFSIAGAALLAASLLNGPLGLQHVNAAVACRSDPILVVNGSIVDVVSTLQTVSSAVSELDYTVTVPAGSLIGQTTLTVGLGFPEKVTYRFSSTQRWGTLQIAASVIAKPGIVPFPTSVQASSLLASSTGAGQSNSTVIVSLGNQLML
jgi:hypothetical protein